MGPPPAGKGMTVRCVASQVAGNGRKLGALTPGVNSLAEKGPELVWKVDWYQLDCSRLVPGDKCQVGAGIFTSPRVRATVVEFSLVNERVASMYLRVAR